MLDMQILQLGWMTVTYSLADTVLTNCLVQLLEVNNKSAAFCLIAPMAFSAKVDAIRRIITTAAVPLPVESPAADVLLKKLDTLNKACSATIRSPG
jgi:hypothetical protein